MAVTPHRPSAFPPHVQPSFLFPLPPVLPLPFPPLSDLSTDGRWCFFVFWVIPRPPPRVLSHPSPSSTPLPMPVRSIKWSLLRQRLLTVCPSSDPVFPLPLASSHSSSRLLLPLPSTMTVPAQINGESALEMWRVGTSMQWEWNLIVGCLQMVSYNGLLPRTPAALAQQCLPSTVAVPVEVNGESLCLFSESAVALSQLSRYGGGSGCCWIR